jgi:hypothetical protein
MKNRPSTRLPQHGNFALEVFHVGRVIETIYSLDGNIEAQIFAAVNGSEASTAYLRYERQIFEVNVPYRVGHVRVCSEDALRSEFEVVRGCCFSASAKTQRALGVTIGGNCGKIAR